MKILTLFTLFIAASFPATAKATSYWINGNMLLGHYKVYLTTQPQLTRESSNYGTALGVGICLGYILGVSDANNLDFHSGVNRQQLVDIVGKYLLDNPDKLHWGADKLILKALEPVIVKTGR